jgi:hypothetical protein
MAQDRWRDQDQWRDEERRRSEDEERRRYAERDQGRDYGRERYGNEERYGGYGGQEYGRGPEYGRGRYGEEQRFGAGRPYRGFEPTGYPGTGGFGYIPSQYPEEGRFGRDYGRSYGQREESGFRGGRYGAYGQDWPGRGYEETYPRGQERGWWDRTRDEVYSWMGDEAAERRRRADEMRGGYYGRGPKGYTRSDERIREDVSDRLTDDWTIDATNIEVTVSNGDVTLAGTVDSREAKRRAEDCAESVSGVKNVQNNLRVQQPTEETSAFGTSATSTTTGTSTGSSKRST